MEEPKKEGMITASELSVHPMVVTGEDTMEDDSKNMMY
jgi:hypothetical protein